MRTDFEDEIEIGAEDEEEGEEEELEDITMEYADDDEGVCLFENLRLAMALISYFDSICIADEEYEYYDEEIEEESADGDDYEYEDDSGVAYVPEDWANFDSKFEEPVTPLLESDDANPHYQQAKESVLSEIENRKRIAEEEEKIPRNIQSEQDVRKLVNYFQNEMTDEEKKEVQSDPDVIAAEQWVKDNNMQITEDDLKDIITKDKDGNEVLDPKAVEKMMEGEVPFEDMHGYDAFPSSTDTENGGASLFPPNKAYSEKDLVEIDDLLRQYRDVRAEMENQTFIGGDPIFSHIDVERDWDLLDNETQDEMLYVMETDTTMACPEPELWLMYDNNFNVTNLILSSFKHNQEAPILFTQWMPQLRVYERYADQREREFEWTWDDVEAADMTELERYYKGIGYDSIPKKEPSETGIIELDESELDDEEREMLALENWYDEVFNEDEQNLLFDDETFQAKDNVFAPEYQPASEKDQSFAEKFIKEVSC